MGYSVAYVVDGYEDNSKGGLNYAKTEDHVIRNLD